MSTGTWRKRGALKLKRKYDRLRRELDFATERQCTVQTVRTEKVSAAMEFRSAVFGDVRAFHTCISSFESSIRHILRNQLAEKLDQVGAIRYWVDYTTGIPVVRADLNIAREA